MSVTLTFYAWWLWAYLALGAVLWLPLTWWSYKTTHNPGLPFWLWTIGNLRRHRLVGSSWRIAAQVALWPVVIWEGLR